METQKQNTHSVKVHHVLFFFFFSFLLLEKQQQQEREQKRHLNSFQNMKTCPAVTKTGSGPVSVHDDTTDKLRIQSKTWKTENSSGSQKGVRRGREGGGIRGVMRRRRWGLLGILFGSLIKVSNQ